MYVDEARNQEQPVFDKKNLSNFAQAKQACGWAGGRASSPLPQ